MGKTFYEIDGKPSHILTSFRNSIKYEYHRDSESGAFYTTVLIPQTDVDGNKQYPFMMWPNYPNGGTESVLQMCTNRKFVAAINGAGIVAPYGEGVTVSGLPIGIVIQNGVLLQDHGNADPVAKTLTIDRNGTLGYAAQSVTAAQLISQGVISTVSAYYPLVYNYKNIDEFESDVAEHLLSSQMTSDAQRQVICQYENGDYLIITSEGRGYQGGGFFTGKRMQAVCKQYGVKFAYMLDGGGSASTVVGQKQLNSIYENGYGRVMPTYLVFNGTTSFKSTNA